MRRWNGLVDRYLERYVAAGRAAGTIEGVRRELERCGAWLRSRRPRPKLDAVDSDLLIAYIRSRSAFHANGQRTGSVYDATAAERPSVTAPWEIAP